MADYTPQQFQQEVMKRVATALCSNAIKNVITIFHQQAIQEEVYDTYSPTQYDRRYNNGGLIDESNLDWDFQLDGDTATLLMKNITEPINNSLSSDDLMNIIENGIGYDWENSSIYKNMPYPRRFIQRTKELIEENMDLFIELLRKELVKNGLKIE